ncbi:hypothetical protein [Mesorhizobium sp. M0088]|uniref:hypothetical protein n=1 Tax=Mesorhizobium sp. M0088 TaxID=2956873 RepID=UPI00333AFF8E
MAAVLEAALLNTLFTADARRSFIRPKGASHFKTLLFLKAAFHRKTIFDGTTSAA